VFSWFRHVEMIDYTKSCICCGSSTIDPMQIYTTSKEILLQLEFADYVKEFILFKFADCPESSVVLKWDKVPSDGVRLFSTADSDYSNTAKLLLFLKVKFDKARKLAEK
jgi:hypothetical protein